MKSSMISPPAKARPWSVGARERCTAPALTNCCFHTFGRCATCSTGTRLRAGRPTQRGKLQCEPWGNAVRRPSGAAITRGRRPVRSGQIHIPDRARPVGTCAVAALRRLAEIVDSLRRISHRPRSAGRNADAASVARCLNMIRSVETQRTYWGMLFRIMLQISSRRPLPARRPVPAPVPDRPPPADPRPRAALDRQTALEH